MRDQQVAESISLVCAMRERYADRFCEYVEPVSKNLAIPWHPKVSQFEIDAYLIWCLSTSMTDSGQPHEAWKAAMFLCRAVFEEKYAAIIAPRPANDVGRVVTSRVESYATIAKTAGEKKESLDGSLMHTLARHLINSACAKELLIRRPLFILDFFRFERFVVLLHPIHAGVVIEFMFVLRQLFKATKDVRTLSKDETLQLIVSSMKEAKEVIETQTDAVKTFVVNALKQLDLGESTIQESEE